MPKSAESSRNPSLVVIDDGEANAYILTRIASLAGFNVHQAYSGETGLELVERVAPDLVVLDLRLPDMDGFDVCRQLHSSAETSHIPVVMVSSAFYDVQSPHYGEVEKGRREAIEAGAVDILPRGDALEQLGPLLQRMWKQRLAEKRSEKRAATGRKSTGSSRKKSAGRRPTAKKSAAKKSATRKSSTSNRTAGKRTASKRSAAKSRTARRAGATRRPAKKRRK